MERAELHSKVEEKLTECWDAYKDMLLTLPPGQIIDKAGEIAAARSCLDELAEHPEYYPEYLLEHLLQYDDPLEILREQWMDEQCVDHSGEMEHALWSLWDHGPLPDKNPAMGGMSME